MSVDPPDGPAGLTAAWLTAALRQAGYPGAQIADAVVTEIGTGQTGSCFRVAVRFAGPTDLPVTFVAKLPASDPSVRERVAFGYRAEVAFYESVAATVRVPLPRCYFRAISADAQTFVLLLEDLSPARPGDQLAGCSPEQARAAVIALAGLHGPRWCDPAWRDFTATAMPMADAELAASLGDVARMAADMFLERLGGRLAPADRDALDGYPARVAPWLLAHPDRFSLLHGDYRLDNLMLGPLDGSVTVVDWQTLSVGLPARDLAYFVATSLPPDMRADHERELVASYHAALVGHGVAGYDLPECFADYCLGMLQTPLITTLGAAFSTTTARGDEVALVLLERAFTAMRELDTFGIIDREIA
jgi:aminoglycoside phosphotransferase (APT) family kinase protein